MTFYLLVLLLLVASPGIFATEFIVGDDHGWNQGVDYSAWVAGKTFTVGDTLVFNYGLPHTVILVDEASYGKCDKTKPLMGYTGGKNTITLLVPGTMYFLCPFPGHCSQGQKLAITVVLPTTIPTPPTSLSPPTGSTTNSPPPPPPKGNGADGRFCFTSRWMVGVSLVLTTVMMRFVA